MPRCRVTAIVPFFNAARFLGEAVDSVLSQTFRDWELWLIDDGAADGSSELARRFARTYSDRIHYAEHRGHANRGPAASRNAGGALASGEFLAFLDADDVWLPAKLERQVAILDAHRAAGMVCGPSQYWYSWSGRAEDASRDFVPLMLHELGLDGDGLVPSPRMLTLAYPLGTASAPAPSSLVVRRSLFRRVAGFEEPFRGRLQLYEDQTFLTKVYLHSAVYVTGQWNERYRQHPESCDSRVIGDGHYLEVRRYFLQWLGGYLEQQGVHDAFIAEMLDKALAGCR